MVVRLSMQSTVTKDKGTCPNIKFWGLFVFLPSNGSKMWIQTFLFHD